MTKNSSFFNLNELITTSKVGKGAKSAEIFIGEIGLKLMHFKNIFFITGGKFFLLTKSFLRDPCIRSLKSNEVYQIA